MAPQVKVLATEPDDPSPYPWDPHSQRRERAPTSCPLTPYVYPGTCMCAHT